LPTKNKETNNKKLFELSIYVLNIFRKFLITVKLIEKLKSIIGRIIK
jgi:hypothetical protein